MMAIQSSLMLIIISFSLLFLLPNSNGFSNTYFDFSSETNSDLNGGRVGVDFSDYTELYFWNYELSERAKFEAYFGDIQLVTHFDLGGIVYGTNEIDGYDNGRIQRDSNFIYENFT